MPHDQLFKELLQAFFQEFMELFFPQVAAHLDFDRVTFLDKETFTDLPKGKKREADLVARVYTLDGRPEIILTHIEVEARRRGNFGERLVQTLSIQHVGFFLLNERNGTFALSMTEGNRRSSAVDSDLSFLEGAPGKPYLFFERTRRLLDVVSNTMPSSVKAAIAELDYTYYVPCSVRGRIVGWIGLSRTNKGDFLSSDDVELVITLSGYLAIAIENAWLYRSLQSKVEEYERLKEFSENIVESINVGILAADLDDRVESWNSQIEKLTGVARNHAVGRRLSELFPADLCEQFTHARGLGGVQNIYKFVLQPEIPGLSSHGGGKANGVVPPVHIVNLAIAPLVSKDLEQIGLDQPFRRDRPATFAGVHLVEERRQDPSGRRPSIP